MPATPTRPLIILFAVVVTLVGASFMLKPTRPRDQTLDTALISTKKTPEYPELARIKIDEPVISAEHVLVQRVRNNQVLYGKDVDSRVAVASLTKLMTTLLLAEHTAPLETIHFSREAKEIGRPDDKRSSLPPGSKIKAEDVAKLLLISSDNDAAYAAAEYIGTGLKNTGADGGFTRSVAAFVTLMNSEALRLKLTNTHFANPAGSDDPENYSTARDIATLLEHIRGTHPELLAISRIQEVFVLDASGKRYDTLNTNTLLRRFPGIYASKTGFDDEAKGALAMLYQFGPEELMSIVILKSPDRFGDGEALIRWLENSFALNTVTRGTSQ